MSATATIVRVTRFGFFNAYLVVEEDGLTLVDTMIPGSARLLLDRAQGLGLPIVRIALTHAHQDHVGSLDALAERLAGVEVLISARDARLLEGEKRPQPGEPADAKLRGGYPKTRTRATRTLAAGDRVGSLEAVSSPGHSPGQLAFLDTRDRTLLAGDAWATFGGLATAAKSNGRVPFPALASWHRPTALQSARELRALEPSLLAPGHGKPMQRPGPAMDAAIERAARSLQAS